MAVLFRSTLTVAAMVLAISVAHAGSDDEAAMPEGDADRGAETYENSCSGCHSLDRNRIGPAHRGVYGSKAGSAPEYAYSAALAAADFEWDAESLDGWLANPMAYVPGAKMGFRLGDPQKRADIIAFLKRESEPPAE